MVKTGQQLDWDGFDRDENPLVYGIVVPIHTLQQVLGFGEVSLVSGPSFSYLNSEIVIKTNVMLTTSPQLGWYRFDLDENL
jgi:hypothetical protein